MPGVVIVVTGPTAAGKTPLAIEIALRFGGEIVNADSMQVYRHLDIGTAKPSLEERARVPHHLFDVVTPDVRYSAGRYAREARSAAEAIHAAGAVVVLTGGTGLYIRAFLQGMVVDAEVDPEIRAGLERQHEQAVGEGDPDRLHRRLCELDPEAAARVHPNDARRTLRALEILEQQGERASSLRRRHGFADRPYRSLHLAIDPGREALGPRVDRRCHAMIEGGLLQEVRDLRERGYGPELRSMQAIGYRHLNAVVEGSDTLVNAERAMRRDTRQFARRQRTWLRKVEEAEWWNPEDEKGILDRVEGFLRANP
ncbi:MAG: tRNA (adenosine(37)-N6)-dimethylallyltransferase MiaA [Proteobacteria bacterium]|nr:tRNA (adenosine(37)-N6)-dimethylallyltransferase MiaA [Pseudomonadota bacterium]